MPSLATLHFFREKASAGKSTRAQSLARQHHALRPLDDVWPSGLYGDQIKVFDDAVRFSQKLKSVVEPLVIDLLAAPQSGRSRGLEPVLRHRRALPALCSLQRERRGAPP